jgi:uncharacterized protein (DUF111 family)
VLCKFSLKGLISEILIRETSTFGFRSFPVEKTELSRSFWEIETKFGKIRVKNASFGDNIVRKKPEYEDCVRLALENHVPLIEVYREAEKLLNS